MTKPSAQQMIDAIAGLEDPESLKYMLQLGGDPNARAEGRAALDHAVTYGYVDKVRLLLEHGANPNLHEDPDPQNDGRFVTPLIAAVRDESHIAIVDELLRAGADANQPDNLGMTPLMCAAASGSEEAVSVLLSSGADPRRETPDGQTALHFAMTRDSPRIVEMLVKVGLDVNARTSGGGLSPAQLARKRELHETLAILDKSNDEFS